MTERDYCAVKLSWIKQNKIPYPAECKATENEIAYWEQRGRMDAYSSVLRECGEFVSSLEDDYSNGEATAKRMQDKMRDELTLLQNRCFGFTQGKYCKTCIMLKSCNALMVLEDLINQYGSDAVKMLFNFKEDDSIGKEHI